MPRILTGAMCDKNPKLREMHVAICRNPMYNNYHGAYNAAHFHIAWSFLGDSIVSVYAYTMTGAAKYYIPHDTIFCDTGSKRALAMIKMVYNALHNLTMAEASAYPIAKLMESGEDV